MLDQTPSKQDDHVVSPSRSVSDLKREIAELRREIERLLRENEALRRGGASPMPLPASEHTNGIHHQSPVKDKIALFRRRFLGRQDVYPVRWENSKGRAGYSPACANEWHQTLCAKPKVKCGACPNARFLPVTDEAVRKHLSGRITMGVYPLQPDGTTQFLAIDFDKSSWKDDVRAYAATCGTWQVPAYIERSRSGNGAHVWIFFEQPLSAAKARRLGSLLLTQTAQRHPGIGLDSYDRLFPSQDTLPKGGFGNLIALPLQKSARRFGNTEFLNESLAPIADQWAFLDRMEHCSEAKINAVLERFGDGEAVLGVASVSDTTSAPPAGTEPTVRLSKDTQLPKRLAAILADGLHIPIGPLPSPLHNALIRLAAFQNPEFYRAQAMRVSTYGKPRIIGCADERDDILILPRGCLEDVAELLVNHDIQFELEDQRYSGSPIDTRFTGTLRPEQALAVDQMLAHDTGLLCAPTAFGKTVVAAAILAKRQTSTLILVHRRQLLTQWKERLATFLDTDAKGIGSIGGGKKRVSGQIDVAVMQSLCRKGRVDPIVRDYGHVIVDEAHHLSAFSFEQILKTVRARFVLGLTATPTRKDGHHPIITMQCGPLRYRVSPAQQRQATSVNYRLIPRITQCAFGDDPSATVQSLYAAIAADDERNTLIFNDILLALEEGRCPLVLTERVAHAKALAERLAPFAKNVILLRGGVSRKNASAALEQLASLPPDQERVVIATGRYVGEGFDDARLDTLFLTMPISWKGTLQQYVGRIHRSYAGKTEVRVYDYVDAQHPMLRKMYERRLTGYRALGYAPSHNQGALAER